MKTLDTLSRVDQLKVLQDMIDLQNTIAGNREAVKETENRISALNADFVNWLKTTANAAGKNKRVGGFIILALIVVAFPQFVILILSGLESSTNLEEFGAPIAMAIVAAIAIFPIHFIRRGYKEKKKKQVELLNSDEATQAGSSVAELRALVDIYNRRISDITTKLYNSFSRYNVRRELQSHDALRFCYNEIYHSANIGINDAFQHFRLEQHRRTMADLQQQQNEEIRRARQQAHTDALKQLKAANRTADAQERTANTLKDIYWKMP